MSAVQSVKVVYRGPDCYTSSRSEEVGFVRAINVLHHLKRTHGVLANSVVLGTDYG